MTRFSGLILAAAIALPFYANAQSIHLCTGIGLDGREEAAAFPHTLKLVYAAPQGSYLGNVAIQVSRGGQTVFEGTCDGPWMLLNVDPGTYKVVSTFEGQTKTVDVRVTKRAVEKIIIFRASR